MIQIMKFQRYLIYFISKIFCINFSTFKEFSKVIEKEMDFQFFLPSSLTMQVDPSYKICYEVLDDVLANILDLHIVEPMSVFQNVLKIRPNKAKILQIRKN